MAPQRDRGSRRLAARHAHRRHRPLLSRPAQRMEIHLPAGCGVSGRTAGGNDRVQDPAGTLGQGPDPDGEEDSAQRDEERSAVSGEAGSLVSPDRESQLSPDGRAFGAAAAGHDHPLLPGMVSDVVHRSAAVYGVHVFDFQLLPGLAARTVSPDAGRGPCSIFPS